MRKKTQKPSLFFRIYAIFTRVIISAADNGSSSGKLGPAKLNLKNHKLIINAPTHLITPQAVLLCEVLPIPARRENRDEPRVSWGGWPCVRYGLKVLLTTLISFYHLKNYMSNQFAGKPFVVVV